MGAGEWEPTSLLFPTYSSAPIRLPKPLLILEEQTAGESERRDARHVSLVLGEPRERYIGRRISAPFA